MGSRAETFAGTAVSKFSNWRLPATNGSSASPLTDPVKLALPATAMGRPLGKTKVSNGCHSRRSLVITETFSELDCDKLPEADACVVGVRAEKSAICNAFVRAL